MRGEKTWVGEDEKEAEAGEDLGLDEDPLVICHLGRDQAGYMVEEHVGGFIHIYRQLFQRFP